MTTPRESGNSFNAARVSVRSSISSAEARDKTRLHGSKNVGDGSAKRSWVGKRITYNAACENNEPQRYE